MDYMTKPTSRSMLRRVAPYVRKIFGVPETGQFPVLDALEKVPDVFKGSGFEIVEDDKMPQNTPARCMPIDGGGFLIEIKESVYRGAYEKEIGAYLGFICHEICHLFLFAIGFKPIYERSFENNQIPAYKSVEWQAKALCGEVMMPYNETRYMSVEQIMADYHVSKGWLVDICGYMIRTRKHTLSWTEHQVQIKKHISRSKNGRKCDMKIELIKDIKDIEMYGDIPCLPVEYSEDQGERFIGEETDSWLMLEDFVSAIDVICPNDLDYGDVDYFDTEKCLILKSWLEGRKKSPMSPRLQIIYQILEQYVDSAIRCGTGVVIEL